MSTTHFFPSVAEGWNRLHGGPLSSHVDDFADWLVDQGYARSSGRQKLRMAGKFSRWMGAQGLDLAALDETQLERFCASQSRLGKPTANVMSDGRELLTWLCETDRVAPGEAEPFHHDPIVETVDRYRRFLVGYALLRLSMMAVSFFIVFGNINYELSGAEIGLLNAIFIGSQAVMRLLFGWLGDRWGHKRNLVISAGAMALAALFALSSTSLAGLIPAFICLACAISSDMVSHFNIVLEFAEPAEQPTYIGLTNTLMAPFTFAGPILAGWIAAAFTMNLLFALSFAFGICGGALLWRWVREPRQAGKTLGAIR